MSVDTVLANATVVTEAGTFPASIAIDAGKIAAVGQDDTMPDAHRRIDLEGRHVLPGVIDVHVHFREPGMTRKEDFGTGSAAAAVGGVTCAFDMPNTDPPTDTVARFEEKRALAEAKAHVDFGLYGLFGEQNLDAFPALVEAGVVGFKLFLGNTTGDLPCPSDGAILEGLERLAPLGARTSVHAENSPILFWRQERLQAAGRNDPLAHLGARTDVVAIEALNRIATLADWTGARVHIVHESCAGSLPFIRFWKSRGTDITVETLPQYLTLSAEMMLEPGGEILRMNPPIRQASHQDPLWEALLDGTIDMLSTDHAPHAIEEKRADTIWGIACGFPGVQTSLPLMLDAVHTERLSLPQLVRIMSGAPARAFGLTHVKGAIRPGLDADLVVVDMTGDQTLTAESLKSRGKVSAYEGRRVRGLPVMTLSRGTLVAQYGEITGQAGHGTLMRPVMRAPPSPFRRAPRRKSASPPTGSFRASMPGSISPTRRATSKTRASTSSSTRARVRLPPSPASCLAPTTRASAT